MNTNHFFKKTSLVAAITSALSVGISTTVFAEGSAESVIDLDIQSQEISKAMIALTGKSKMQIVLADNVSSATLVSSVQGHYSVSNALSVMLSGTGLTYEFISDNTVLIKESERDGASESDSENGVDEEVVVTGTRLKSVDPASPRVTISREDIERGGYANMEDVFRNLPQNLSTITGLTTQLTQNEFGASPFQFPRFNATLGTSGVNLRGLGARSTLVLVNGRRKARSSLGFDGFTDLSSIPISQVERIEIITDGASAIYGADAVAGVVNVILREDYEGLNLALRTESASNSASRERLDAGYTLSWGSGFLTSSFNIEQTEPNDPNRLVRVGPNGPSDLTAFGGVDNRIYGIGGPGEGSVFSTVAALDFFGNLDGDVGTLIAGPNPFFPRDANGNITGPREAGVPSIYRQQDLGPEVERYSLRFNGEQELGDSHTLNFEVSYDRQEDNNHLGFNTVSFNNINPSFRSGNLQVPRDGTTFTQTLNNLEDYLLITASNPNNPFGDSRTDGGTPTDILVGYDFVAEGNLVADARLPIGNELSNLSGGIGVAGDLPFVDGWSYDLHASLSREESMGNSYQTFFQSSAASVLAEQFDAFSGTPEAIAANAELLLNTLDLFRFNNENETVQFTGFMNGPIFNLPAGEVQLALGVEARESRSEGVSTDFAGPSSDLPLRGDPFITGPNEEKVKSVFTEFSIPLLKDLPGIQSLTLTAAARYEKHDRSGFSIVNNFRGINGVIDGIDIAAEVGDLINDTVMGSSGRVADTSSYSNTSPSIGLVWQMVDDVKVSATWGESFLTPTSRQLYGSVQVFPGSFELRSFLPLAQQYTDPITVFGPNAFLEPQTAKTLTFQLAYQPAQLDGLNLSVTYSDLAYSNFIANPLLGIPTQVLVDNFASFPDVFILGDTNTFLFDVREANLASNISRTLDFKVDYNLDSDWGRWGINLNAVRTLETSRQVTPFVPETILDDTDQGPSEWSAVLRLAWEYGNYNATWETVFDSAFTVMNPLTAQTNGGRRFRSTDELPVNLNPRTRGGSHARTDLQIGYAFAAESGWSKGLKVSLGAQNIFNPEAPFVDNRQGLAANRIFASGRVMYLNLTKDFEF